MSTEGLTPTPPKSEPVAVTNTEGKVVPVAPGDTGPAAPIGAFFSARTPGVGRWVTIIGIIGGAAQAVYQVCHEILKFANTTPPPQ